MIKRILFAAIFTVVAAAIFQLNSTTAQAKIDCAIVESQYKYWCCARETYNATKCRLVSHNDIKACGIELCPNPIIQTGKLDNSLVR
jgi:hypothetical protein